MSGILRKYIDKLYFKQWSIGLCRGNIKDIIRDKTFNQDVKWLPLKSFNHFQADPFLIRSKDGNINILHEDFPFDEYYGNISLMKMDNNFKEISHKELLDTKSHLSYPFTFTENNKTFIFPEAAHSGKLTCYEYDPVKESMSFLQDIIDLPLLDSTIIKKDGKYWLFGTLYGEDSHNKLYIFYSDNLLGPYIPHPGNPVKNSLNGTRPAGNFIEVDGVIYRPSQNCENQYGESITINKLNLLNESQFDEEPYMIIAIDRKEHKSHNIYTIHTINILDDIIAVDGMKWTFSPSIQWKIFLKTRKQIRKIKTAQRDEPLKILFFIDTLTSGGKERRMLELIRYLRQTTDYEMALVLTENLIYYEYVYELGIPITIIKRKDIKYDPRLFVKFYRYCQEFKPDIIHAWGKMTTFYAIPAKLKLRIPLVSNMIADTLGEKKVFSLNFLFFRIDTFFSDLFLSNSKAGLTAYKIKSPKARVIWNGVHLERFQQEYNIKDVKEELNVKTEFVIVMIAAFSNLKDYDLFLNVAKEIGKTRDDVTFIGVGNGPEWERIHKRTNDEHIDNVILTGKRRDVERMISISDIGLLCTYSEGISNSIIESMALGKPVISTDIFGASKEIIVDGETGYCIERNTEKVVDRINILLNDKELRSLMGQKGRERINSLFSIERMGNDFKQVYKEVLAQTSDKKFSD